MIHHISAVADLHKEILGQIVEKDISADAGALRLPIQPKRTVAAVNDIPANLGIQRSVKLDPPHFCAVENALVMNIVNAVLVNLAESAA
ncbi:hypothetical protein D3C75_1021690 [compost metagenome]